MKSKQHNNDESMIDVRPSGPFQLLESLCELLVVEKPEGGHGQGHGWLGQIGVKVGLSAWVGVRLGLGLG